MDLLESVKAFCSVSEHGSLTRSAAALGISASVLSRQLSALENSVGTKLLYRTGRGVVPTEAGRRALPRALAILHDSESLLTELRADRESPAGDVALALVPAARPWVVPLFKQLQRSFPRIRLLSHEGYSGQVEEWLAAGKVDLAMFNRYGDGRVADGDVLQEGKLVLIGRRQGFAFVQPEVSFEKLGGLPLAMPSRPNALLTCLESTAHSCGVNLQTVFESGSDALIRDAVEDGCAFTVVPLHVAFRNYGSERFAWTRLAESHLVQSTWLAYTHAHPRSNATQVVARLLKGIASKADCDPDEVP